MGKNKGQEPCLLQSSPDCRLNVAIRIPQLTPPGSHQKAQTQIPKRCENFIRPINTQLLVLPVNDWVPYAEGEVVQKVVSFLVIQMPLEVAADAHILKF